GIRDDLVTGVQTCALPIYAEGDDGLRFRWVFDAVRQFGAAAAMAVVETAKTCKSKTIVAFGIGGDELQVETAAFRGVYERAAEQIGRASCRERGEGEMVVR